ncbi:MAG: site-2 protease family protein [Oscillospiraceae bacterium]|nr:site-2 protease family protein [Oscillospiraceae bacterium]
MIYLLVAILIFGLLIAVHEFGHFISAKAFNVVVNEFSIGMGPAIFQRKRGETEYSLRIFPLGGYCALEDEECVGENPRGLGAQSFWKKIIIFAAGAVMNFITGFVIICVLYAGAGGFYTAEITDLHPDFPQTGEQGIMVGDVIHRINGERIYMQSDVELVMNCLPFDENGTMEMEVVRGGEKLTRTLTLQTYTNEEGEEYRAYGFTYGGLIEATPLNRLQYSWYSTIDLARMVKLSLQMLLGGRAGVDDLAGPVGIVSTITQVGEESETAADAAYSIAYFAALIAVNLAVMNLLPLPALDGGKILFLVINTISFKLFKKKIPEKYENYIHFAGFALLILLLVAVTFNDITRLFA